MSHDKDAEFVEAESTKPVKRVRFSDEVEDVFEFDESDENGGSISTEDQSNNDSANLEIFEQNNPCTEDLIDDIEDSHNKTIIHNDYSLLTSNVNNSNGISSRGEICSELTYSHEEINLQCIDSSIKDSVECSLSTGNFVAETDSLNELIVNTELMTISSTETVQSGDHFHSPNKLSTEDSSGIETEKNVLEVTVLPIDQKDTVTRSRKRPLEEMQIEKQTSKLNSYLRKNNSNINSADDLKTAVFNAWYEVKKERSVLNTPCAPVVKNIVNTTQKTPPHNAYSKWKRSKKKANKINYTKISEPVPQKTKEEIEESKMAFQAWKKKKDELLQYQIAEKYRQEESERLNSIMKERLRKNDAESAFIAWNAHKAVVFKMIKKKQMWLLEREKEKMQEKLKKNDDAAKVYYQWLRNKVYSPKANNHTVTEDKPPWSPPGKATSFV